MVRETELTNIWSNLLIMYFLMFCRGKYGRRVKVNLFPPNRNITLLFINRGLKVKD